MVLKLKPSNKIENAPLIAVVYCVIDNIFPIFFFFFENLDIGMYQIN